MRVSYDIGIAICASPVELECQHSAALDTETYHEAIVFSPIQFPSVKTFAITIFELFLYLNTNRVVSELGTVICTSPLANCPKTAFEDTEY